MYIWRGTTTEFRIQEWEWTAAFSAFSLKPEGLERWIGSGPVFKRTRCRQCIASLGAAGREGRSGWDAG